MLELAVSVGLVVSLPSLEYHRAHTSSPHTLKRRRSNPVLAHTTSTPAPHAHAMPVESKPGKPTLEDEEGPDASLRKLLTSRGVQCYAVLNRSGIPIKAAGMEHTDSLQYASLLSELTLATQQFLASSQQLLASNTATATATTGTLSSSWSSELVSLRLKSTQHELIVTPDENYTLIVLHNPNVGASGIAGMAAAGATAGEAGGAEGGEKKIEAKKPAAEEKESSD